jgi:hypothetical protein
VQEIVGLPGRAEDGVVETADISTTRDDRLVRADEYPPHADRFVARGFDVGELLDDGMTGPPSPVRVDLPVTEGCVVHRSAGEAPTD